MSQQTLFREPPREFLERVSYGFGRVAMQFFRMTQELEMSDELRDRIDSTRKLLDHCLVKMEDEIERMESAEDQETQTERK